MMYLSCAVVHINSLLKIFTSHFNPLDSMCLEYEHYRIRHDDIVIAQKNGPREYYKAPLVKWAKTMCSSWYRGLHMGIASTIYYG